MKGFHFRFSWGLGFPYLGVFSCHSGPSWRQSRLLLEATTASGNHEPHRKKLRCATNKQVQTKDSTYRLLRDPVSYIRVCFNGKSIFWIFLACIHFYLYGILPYAGKAHTTNICRILSNFVVKLNSTNLVVLPLIR